MASETNIVDGSVDFSGGVDSNKTPTVESEINSNGLKRNQLAWLINATTREGGIRQRTGWNRLGTVPFSGLYQGGWMYVPSANANPYLVLSVGGVIVRVDIEPVFHTTQLSTALTTNPALVDQAFFCQGLEFLVIQPGDYQTTATLPLFWNGTTLRRSVGLAVAPALREIPAAGPMDFYMGRLWYANGMYYTAGDIVGGLNGTAPFYRDAILKVTENPLALGGDGFAVPTNAGNIRALTHTANLDSALGQGQLIIATRKSIYGCTVPVTRDDWIDAGAAGASGSTNQPVQTVIQQTNGGVGDRCFVAVNGDLFYQSLEPSIRSLITAVRYFNQWGNTPISSEELRILQYNDRSLMRFATGVEFDNRLLMGVAPKMTSRGVVHQCILPLNFETLSTLSSRSSPAWEGMWEGLDILQLFTGDFGGLERCIAVVVSRETQAIDVWDLTNYARFENGDNRVKWQIEWPSFTWGDEFLLKKLVSAELWLDKVYGEVLFDLEYRPDGDPCWYPWHHFKACAARDSSEDGSGTYPLTTYRESYRSMMTMPRPPEKCANRGNRPAYIGYQFQPRLTITGWCRVRGLLLYAEKVERKLYLDLACAT